MADVRKIVGCCIFVSGLLVFTYMILGLLILGNNRTVNTACEYLWAYSFSSVEVATFILVCIAFQGSIVSVGGTEFNTQKKITILYILLSLALFIWGIIIKAQITKECIAMYQTNAPQLYTLFQVSFALMIFIFITSLITISSIHTYLKHTPPPVVPII
ncbi:MAG: hypothetical protein Harvfovirus2_12 [Harvfovirus sp.]|uniref:Uncharacterized protein n=1 Tax=Harvfovirus sp. TaxID=2487768 RepID=A0A3G5A010_9VIRU|nr:MAG: hypothetical protein Harvfovirus2_12 [Harvfovirus sp.]